MLEKFFSFSSLPEAIGSAAIVLLLGTFISGRLEKSISERLSTVVGFSLAALIGTSLGAFALADGGDPEWVRAFFQWGIPAFLGGCILSAMKYLEKKEKAKVLANTLPVFPVVVIVALFGINYSSYSSPFDDPKFLNDPMMKGLEGLRQHNPSLWGSLREQIDQVASSTDDVGEVSQFLIDFWQDQLPNIVQSASDAGVVKLQTLGVKSIEILAEKNPLACMQMTTGSTSPEHLAMLPLDHKLEIEKAKSNLFPPQGQNSGKMSEPEAESLALEAWRNLAATSPTRYYAIMEEINGGSDSQKEACLGMADLENYLMSMELSKSAAYARSDFNLDPDLPPSSDFVIGMIQVDAIAFAQSIKEIVPVELDDVTTLVDVDFKDSTLSYVYALSQNFDDVGTFTRLMKPTLLENACEDEKHLLYLENGMDVAHFYFDAREEVVSISIDSEGCTNR